MLFRTNIEHNNREKSLKAIIIKVTNLFYIVRSFLFSFFLFIFSANSFSVNSCKPFCENKYCDKVYTKVPLERSKVYKGTLLAKKIKILVSRFFAILETLQFLYYLGYKTYILLKTASVQYLLLQQNTPTPKKTVVLMHCLLLLYIFLLHE